MIEWILPILPNRKVKQTSSSCEEGLLFKVWRAESRFLLTAVLDKLGHILNLGSYFNDKLLFCLGQVRKRQALIESKTPAELSQINSFSEIPLPKRIEDWLHHNEATGSGLHSEKILCCTSVPLASTRWGWLPFSSLCPLYSKQRRQ